MKNGSEKVDYKAILKFYTSIRDIRGVLLFSQEGHLLAYALPSDLNPNSFASICQKVVNKIEDYLSKLNKNKPINIIIEYKLGYLKMRRIAGDLLLVLIFDIKSEIEPNISADRHGFFKKGQMKQGVETEFL